MNVSWVAGTRRMLSTKFSSRPSSPALTMPMARAVAGFDFFDAGLDFVVERGLRGEADHRDARLDQGQRAVLQLPAGYASAWM